MVLQRVYGSKSEAQDQLKQPILALAAGYMPFYAKKRAVVQTKRMTSDPQVQQTYSERVALFAKNESVNNGFCPEAMDTLGNTDFHAWGTQFT